MKVELRSVLQLNSPTYTLEEVDTATKYVIPDARTAAIEWNSVTNKSFANILKKWNATVTKSDAETGIAQGDASLAGAVYGVYKGDQLIDSYTTDANGQFTTDYYVCGSDWTIREISPSEGYLLDSTTYPVDAEASHYTLEHNSTSVDVLETVMKGSISIIKHTDNGDTQIETPEEGAEFCVYLKSAGSYDAAKESERDYLTCDENGYAQTKEMPYGIYTVHQISGWEGRELIADFDVLISADGEIYRYLINNANFESFIKVIKVDAETGNTIPYAGAAFQIYKQELIKQAFADWIWQDPARREKLCRLYNEKFNSIRPREYDGSHLHFVGINPEITLRPHQVNAIAHIIYGGNTLLAHVVGAGKTFEMVAAAMESKRLGLCQKSLFVVPNHLTEQWAAEFLQLYPSANILVATRKDFETKNRKRFCGRIATGDYDAIIIGHSQFEKIPMSLDRQRLILEQQLQEIMDGISELKRNRGDSFSVLNPQDWMN